jgi:outer membrane protein, heavy metal efflux system
MQGFMKRFLSRLSVAIALIAGLAGTALCQHVLTWQQVKDRFAAANPSLEAGQIGIDESRAAEITARLRPNPNLGLTVDQINPFNGGPPHSAAGSLLTVATVSYLYFLDAQASYRSVQVNYLNLVASYLDAANQLNLAVGREVLQ